MSYTPPEKMTIEQLKAEVDASFEEWERIKEDGCQDPSWPDGVNMNLVRNHIIFWYQYLQEKISASNEQLSLFDVNNDPIDKRPVPPVVPNSYMAPNGKHSHRLDKSPFWPNIVHEI